MRHQIEIVQRLDKRYVARIIDYTPIQRVGCPISQECVFISDAHPQLRQAIHQAREWADLMGWEVGLSEEIDRFTVKTPNEDQKHLLSGLSRPSHRQIKCHFSNRRGGIHDNG